MFENKLVDFKAIRDRLKALRYNDENFYHVTLNVKLLGRVTPLQLIGSLKKLVET